MYTDADTARRELAAYGVKIAERGLVVGPGGNTSARVVRAGRTTVYVKASGKCFEDGNPADYVGVDPATGAAVDGGLKPTCELAMHLGCYRERPDIGAIIHTHAPYAIGYGLTGKPLKAFTPDMVAVVGAVVPVVPYVIPAGDELAEAVAPRLRKHNAALMRNHGLIAVGKTLREAWYRTLVVEDAIKSLLAARLFGKFRYFTPAQSRAVDNLGAEAYRRKLMT